MVLKSIARIKNALPEVLQVVMFYNNGIVFQTTFDQSLNIPKIGENLAEMLSHIRKFYELCAFNFEEYNKLIIETGDISCIILKLGEESNLALFFKKEVDINQKLKSIRRYIKRIEHLVDMDQYELEFQELKEKQEEINRLNSELEAKQNKILGLRSTLKDGDILKQEEITKMEKELGNLKEMCEKYRSEIDQKQKAMDNLKVKIEKERKKGGD